MQAPTKVRIPTEAEWSICTDVFGHTLPRRQRVFMTDGLGFGRVPFTIPTSALDMTTTIPSVIVAALGALIASKTGKVGEFLSTVFNVADPPPMGIFPMSQINGLINIGFIMNVGSVAFADMTASQHLRDLLVHEMAHVWQGHNGLFPMSYVINSAFHQCQGIIDSDGRGAAYSYTPGGSFDAYNAEQQASIIEDWYSSGMPQSGDLWPYIENHVRQGRGW